MSYMKTTVDRANKELETLRSTLGQERLALKQSLQVLVDDIVSALQTRDMTIQAMRSFEKHCLDRGVSVEPLIQVQSCTFHIFFDQD